MTEFMSAYAAGVAPQWGASASPRTYRYAPIFEPDMEPWRAAALCAQSGPDEWFPEKGQAVRRAVAICHRCPSEDPCLAYSLTNEIKYGVWGGTSQGQREKLIKDRKAAELQDRLHGETVA